MRSMAPTVGKKFIPHTWPVPFDEIDTITAIDAVRV